MACRLIAISVAPLYLFDMLQRTLPAGFIAPCLPTKTDKLPSARASNFQNGRFLSSQWFPDKPTSAQTNSRAPSVVLNQIGDLWSPSTFHRARDRRSSCRILAGFV